MGKNSGYEKVLVLVGVEVLGNEINFGEEIVMGDNSIVVFSVILFCLVKFLFVECDG